MCAEDAVRELLVAIGGDCAWSEHDGLNRFVMTECVGSDRGWVPGRICAKPVSLADPQLWVSAVLRPTVTLPFHDGDTCVWFVEHHVVRFVWLWGGTSLGASAMAHLSLFMTLVPQLSE